MKNCEICQKEFGRPKGCSFKLWEKRTTCSTQCRIERMRQNKIGFQPGHPGYKNSGSFKTKHKPWNKGVKGKQAWHNLTGLVVDGSLNHGRPMSASQKAKLSRRKKGKPVFSNRGDKHYNWKGGTTKLRKQIMQLNAYKLWRQVVYEKDNWTCQGCGKYGVYFHADHIKPYSHIIEDNNIKTVQDAKKCTELWDVSNGRTLCVSCHLETKTWGTRCNRN